ncbi:MAG: peptidylprolyl isomerase [Saprospiraceae bacterium]|nr:peptidylprolyl isomerase [Saprospiraceae bacterium]
MYNKFLFALIFTLAFLRSFAQSDDAVLMSVNGNPVSVGEFRYIYEKNNGKEANYSEKSIREYLDLYARFKLKVARARELRLDTIQALNEELNGYKRQLANSYLTDREIMDHLLKEFQQRQNEDIRFSHILISANEKATDSLKQAALAKIEVIKKEIAAGKSFEAAAKEYSDDKGTAIQGGDLGFFTAMLPDGFYDIENAIYTLPFNVVSNPLKSKLGYHLIKVVEKRQARGTISVAHILIKHMDKSETPKIKINEAYERLLKGEDFSELAALYSEDKQTSKNGGYLPVFGINTYEAVFEESAFGLANDGDISKPIETKSGWHILKRIKKVNFGEDFATFKKMNEAKIKKDERFALARKRLVEDIKKSSGYVQHDEVFNKFVSSLNEEFLSFKWSPQQAASNKEVIMSFGGDTHYTVADFAAFCKKNTKSRLKYDKNSTAVHEVATALLKEFSEEKAIDYEQKMLEIKYPDFKALMREYEEGILLFEATKHAVWDKANQDSVGLASFHMKNQDKYKTEEKGNLLVYTIMTTDMKEAEKVAKFAMKKGPEEVMKKFNKKSQMVSYIEETLEKQNARFAGMTWELGTQTPINKSEGDQGYKFSKITKIFPVRNKTLKEARGYVVADYQDYLEKEWLIELSLAYKVETNEAVVKSLIKK